MFKDATGVMTNKMRKELEDELIIIEGCLETQHELYEDFFNAHLDREKE